MSLNLTKKKQDCLWKSFSAVDFGGEVKKLKVSPHLVSSPLGVLSCSNVACVAVWKWWAQEKTGAREGSSNKTQILYYHQMVRL